MSTERNDEAVTRTSRSRCSSSFAGVPRRCWRGMDATAMWGFILIGAGALVAGLVGIVLPPGERLGAFLTLVIGAGVGVAALAVGTRNVSSQSDMESAFLVASALGLIAVVVSAAVLWQRVPKPPAAP